MDPFEELKKTKTLLVDDDEFIRNSVDLAFRTRGCELHVVENAEDGLQAVKDRQFNIIISDLRLPGINGLDFLKLTSVTHPKAIRFLITAYRDDRFVSEAIRSGIHQLIDKPFTINVLVSMLAVELKRQSKDNSN